MKKGGGKLCRIRPWKKQGQTVHMLQTATFLDPLNYLGPPELFGSPVTCFGPP